MTFSAEVYEEIREGAKRSAAAVVPVVVDLVAPKTVSDFGCGEGWWAREFAKHGCEVIAMDSSVEMKYEEDGVLFCARDLEPAPALQTSDRGPDDLAVSLEVAEHLSQAGGDRLVESLVNNGRVVLFSAAIPGQGGHLHVNEQWPDYWAAKFFEHGFVASEFLRWEFWDDPDVEPWYRQNLLLFARYEWFDAHGIYDFTKHPRSCVHPVIWEHRRQRP